MTIIRIRLAPRTVERLLREEMKTAPSTVASTSSQPEHHAHGVAQQQHREEEEGGEEEKEKDACSGTKTPHEEHSTYIRRGEGEDARKKNKDKTKAWYDRLGLRGKKKKHTK